MKVSTWGDSDTNLEIKEIRKRNIKNKNSEINKLGLN